MFPSQLIKPFWTLEMDFFYHIFMTQVSAISSSITNFVGYVIPLSGGYEQMQVPLTVTSGQWHIHICTGHMNIMPKNKLGESKHRSSLLLEVSGAL
jgi:hypothetical protein